ncbi:MAG: glycine C-acetyltransferase [Alphaproteobacteria bacterium]
MSNAFVDHLNAETQNLRQEGLFKQEHYIQSPQGTDILVQNDNQSEVLNFCANNYLGLANHPELVKAAKDGIDKFGYGMASVRFICGTQQPHQDLEKRLSKFLGTEDTITYSSCYAANTGLFETLLGKEDAIISDALNHASLIDGIRLCKAQRFLYPNGDMAALEKKLQEAQDCRYRMIVTDGVFSMDGFTAKLPEICALAEKYDAMVTVDDSHAVGVLGSKGQGTADHYGVADRVDIFTGTLGKGLGGSAGGYVSGKAEVIEWLRQRSRTYLFSNALPPAISCASIRALEMLEESAELRETLHSNTAMFRQGMENLGFELLPGSHPIVPVMLGDANLATNISNALLKEGIYVIGFSFPVVPKGEARIRVQISAAHTPEQIQKAIDAFGKVGREFGAI